MKISELIRIAYYRDSLFTESVKKLKNPSSDRKRMISNVCYRFGAFAISALLKSIDLHALSIELNKSLSQIEFPQKQANLEKSLVEQRKDIVNAMIMGNIRPENVLIERIPIFPTEQRPLQPYSEQKLLHLYRGILVIPNRLVRLQENYFPEELTIYEYRHQQTLTGRLQCQLLFEKLIELKEIFGNVGKLGEHFTEWTIKDHSTAQIINAWFFAGNKPSGSTDFFSILKGDFRHYAMYVLI